MPHELDGMEESHAEAERLMNQRPKTVREVVAATGLDATKTPAPSVFNDPLFQEAVRITKLHQAWLMDGNNEAVRDPAHGQRDPFMPAYFIR